MSVTDGVVLLYCFEVGAAFVISWAAWKMYSTRDQGVLFAELQPINEQQYFSGGFSRNLDGDEQRQILYEEACKLKHLRSMCASQKKGLS